MFLLFNKLFRTNKIYFVLEILLTLIAFTAVFYFCCDDDDFSGLKKDEYNTEFNRFIDIFYFVCVTGATIGYGDIYPKSLKCKLISLFLIFNVLMLSLM
tara:strand:+ start:454 stop:750 length:297 start_codon:yes stop_codon:yes gene_type:complete